MSCLDACHFWVRIVRRTLGNEEENLKRNVQSFDTFPYGFELGKGAMGHNYV